jgi:hypothetical protein
MTPDDEPGEPEHGEPGGAAPAPSPRVPPPRDASARGATPPRGTPLSGGTAGPAGQRGVNGARPDGRTPDGEGPDDEDADGGGPDGGGQPDVPAQRGPEHEATGRRDQADTPAGGGGNGGGSGPGRDTARAVPAQRTAPGAVPFSHALLMSLLGAWALGACSPTETTTVERHLGGCPSCAEEALRLQDAVTLLEPQRALDLDPALRPDVLAGCLARRPAQLPLPDWAEPYEAESARLDSLLNDMVGDEWHTPVRLKWFSGDSPVGQTTTVAGVLDHLIAVDGLLCPVLGLPDPLGDDAAGGGPAERTELRWQRTEARRAAAPVEVRADWRELSRSLVRAAGELGGDAGSQVSYRTPEGFGGGALSLRDAFLDRAFACWVHAEDIASSVAYPYGPPPGPQLRMLVDLAARRLPVSLADRRRAGLAGSPARLAPAGEPGRTLHLEVEGDGGGHWYIPLDSPTAVASRESAVAHVALEDTAFCKLAAGRLTPDEAAAGGDGDPRAIQDMLFATAALSRI